MSLSKEMTSKSRPPKLPDIKPATPIRELDRAEYASEEQLFSISEVSPIVGMSNSFIKKVVGAKSKISPKCLLKLLDQDSFSETFVPRSKILSYLKKKTLKQKSLQELKLSEDCTLIKGNAVDTIGRLPKGSIQTVVTSTPYWAMRIYKDSHFVEWADGESCPYGHEQTPEGFVRHTIEILNALNSTLKEDGSIWWNIMDTFNTRTQIRGNAAEALRAMQGKDDKSWGDHECRRYSAGHSYLKDGEQCLIPSLIAQRASRIGLYVKSVITWAKTSSMPEPQETRVSRNLEYVIHFSKIRAPKFNKEPYRLLPRELGGRNENNETDKLSDVWTLPTSSGRDGHGAQFPVALPARCIALTSEKEDYILDPFSGAGNTGLAALRLGRKYIGIDVSDEYLDVSRKRLKQRSEPQAE